MACVVQRPCPRVLTGELLQELARDRSPMKTWDLPVAVTISSAAALGAPVAAAACRQTSPTSSPNSTVARSRLSPLESACAGPTAIAATCSRLIRLGELSRSSDLLLLGDQLCLRLLLGDPPRLGEAPPRPRTLVLCQGERAEGKLESSNTPDSLTSDCSQSLLT